jgi:hypothetical protein
MHSGYFSGFLLQVYNLARLPKANSSSTWTDSCSLNSLSLLESDLLNFTRIEESRVDGLFSYIVLNVCARLVFVASCMHLVLSFNEIFFILSDHLSVSLISFECIRLILDHLPQMCLFSYQIPNLCEIISELSVLRPLPPCLHVTLHHVLDYHLLGVYPLLVLLPELPHQLLLVPVELLVDAHVRVLLHPQHVLHHLRHLPGLRYLQFTRLFLKL